MAAVCMHVNRTVSRHVEGGLYPGGPTDICGLLADAIWTSPTTGEACEGEGDRTMGDQWMQLACLPGCVPSMLHAALGARAHVLHRVHR